MIYPCQSHGNPDLFIRNQLHVYINAVKNPDFLVVLKSYLFISMPSEILT